MHWKPVVFFISFCQANLSHAQVLQSLFGLWDQQRRINSKFPNNSPDQKIKIIAPIAFQMQKAGTFEVQATIWIDELSKTLPFIGIDSSEAKNFLNEIENRSGLVVERGVGLYGFVHKSVQEFLTAYQLRLVPDGIDEIIAHIHDSEWYEVVLFYAGLGDSSDLIKTMLSLPNDKLLTNLIFSAECALQAVSLNRELRLRIEEELMQWAWPYPTQAWPSLWESCLKTLGRFNNREIARMIAEELHSNQDPWIRAQAATALGFIKMEEVFSELIQALDDKNNNVRIRTALALENLNKISSIDKLLSRLDRENDDDTKMMIVRSIGRNSSDKAVETLCILLKSHEDAGVRTSAAIGLRDFPDNGLAIEALYDALENDLAEDVRLWAADSLAEFGGDEIGRKLSKFLLSDISENVREGIASDLGDFPLEYSIDALFDILQNDSNTFVRMRAATSLAKIGDLRSYPMLYEFVRNDQYDGNWAACIGLEFVHTSEAIELLKRTIQQTEDESLARVAISGLASQNPPDTSEILGDILKNHSKGIVRRDSVIALGRLDNSPIPVRNAIVEAMMTDADDEVREWSAYAIGNLKLDAFIDELESVLGQDNSVNVREAAALSLSKLLRLKPLTVDVARYEREH